MREPAQLVRARAEVMRQAWGQCVSLYVDPNGAGVEILGRCPGNRLEVHHKTKRSAGGGHEPDNLLPVCSSCHTAIEANRRKGPYEDAEGREFYSQDIGARNEVRIVHIYDFRAFQQDLEAAFVFADETLTTGIAWGSKGVLTVAFALEEIERLALWQLDGNDSGTFGDYLRSKGLKIERQTLNNYYRLVRTLGAKGITLGAILERIDRAAALHGCPATYSALRAALPEMKGLDAETILDRIEGVPAPELAGAIEEAEEQRKGEEARAEGRDRVCVRGVATVMFEMTLDSVGSRNDDVAEFKKRICGYKPIKGMEWQKGITRRVVNPA